MYSGISRDIYIWYTTHMLPTWSESKTCLLFINFKIQNIWSPVSNSFVSCASLVGCCDNCYGLWWIMEAQIWQRVRSYSWWPFLAGFLERQNNLFPRGVSSGSSYMNVDTCNNVLFHASPHLASPPVSGRGSVGKLLYIPNSLIYIYKLQAVGEDIFQMWQLWPRSV